jgi:hypothetical protein
MVDENSSVQREPTAYNAIPDPETSASVQDGSSASAPGSDIPNDMGATELDSSLTAGGTDTSINTQGDITRGGYAGDYGGRGDTVGGQSSQDIGTVGEGIPPKPEGDFEV